jgi:hypothetical protein
MSGQKALASTTGSPLEGHTTSANDIPIFCHFLVFFGDSLAIADCFG